MQYRATIEVLVGPEFVLGRALLGKVQGLGRDLKYVHYGERMFFCLWNGLVQEVWNIDK